MELTKTAQACISQAHTQRLRAGIHENLCVEHLFFALLALAHYLEPPFNKPEYLAEGKEVHELLSQKVLSIESARQQLEHDAKDRDAGYRDARAVIGRATEMAENAGSDLTALILAKAVLESPTPTVLAVCGLVNPKHAPEDARYRLPPAEKKPSSEPIRQQQKADSGPATTQLKALLAMLAALEDKGHQNIRQSVQQKKRQPNVKRRTKIGFVRWYGGPVAAFIQYFLFGLLVPAAVLFALNHFTGAVTAPPTPLVKFLVGAFIMISLFNLARGVNLLLGLISKAFGHTLDLVADCLLLAGLAAAAQHAFGFSEIPVWMRAVVCVGALLILLVGLALFRHMPDQGKSPKVRSKSQNFEGTPGTLFFRFLVQNLIFPLLVFSIFWIFNINVPLWLEKTFWILGFLLVTNLLSTMWQCIRLRYQALGYSSGKRKFAMFMAVLHLLWGAPGLAIFLHWLFDWFPMKTWVIVILGIWSLITLMIAAGNAKSAT